MPLCKECQQIAARGAMLQLHCHHNEETPLVKEPCWCEYDEDVRTSHNVSVCGLEGEPDPIWAISHCPVCGKEMVR